MAVYMTDELYGGLVSASPPFDFITAAAIPIYGMFNDEKRLKSFNKGFTYLCFIPSALISVSLFLLGSLLLIPFAYFYAFIHKAIILKQTNTNENLADFFVFMFFGLFMLTVSAFVDSTWFTIELFTYKPQRQSNNRAKVISEENYQVLYETVHMFMELPDVKANNFFIDSS
eukprot:CAMPEP_0116879998 /NCGR_PEP_ID=MMETSP0463-20121206/11852_1 /TAXON_ID=181622 /ORGANISM="Strombidinopsis sp, Strain SopsisLIS2011" /LENGTH=171 /DNA_ID=CAMNT_0004529987 /DNA_START=3115 /DNA_END=3630 /DNA_ORIENTATION=+